MTRFGASCAGATRRCSPRIDAGDDLASIAAELELHGLVYEASGHRLLQRAWHGLRGRLQLYWAAHHRAHGMRGPRRDSHDSYLAAALGDDLDAMRPRSRSTCAAALRQTETFLRTVAVASESPQGRLT